jgi:hypothetical protein
MRCLFEYVAFVYTSHDLHGSRRHATRVLCGMVVSLELLRMLSEKVLSFRFYQAALLNWYVPIVLYERANSSSARNKGGIIEVSTLLLKR